MPEVNVEITVLHSQTADRWATPRRIILQGEVEGEGMLDGSDDVFIETTLNQNA